MVCSLWKSRSIGGGGVKTVVFPPHVFFWNSPKGHTSDNVRSKSQFLALDTLYQLPLSVGIITLFQKDNIFAMDAILIYCSQLQR